MDRITRAKKMRVFDVCNILNPSEYIVVQTRSGNKLYAGNASGIIDPSCVQPECAGYMVVDVSFNHHDTVITVIPTTDDSYTTVMDALNALNTRRPIRLIRPDDLSPIYEFQDRPFPITDPSLWQYHNWPSLGIYPFVYTIGIMVSKEDNVKEDKNDDRIQETSPEIR